MNEIINNLAKLLNYTNLIFSVSELFFYIYIFFFQFVLMEFYI
jgi:hypothetical protein